MPTAPVRENFLNLGFTLHVRTLVLKFNSFLPSVTELSFPILRELSLEVRQVNLFSISNTG